MKKRLLILTLISLTSFTSCSKTVIVDSTFSSTVKSSDEKKEEDEVIPKPKDDIIFDEDNYSKLNSINKGNTTYYYGNLKNAGYNHLYNDIYERNGIKYQIIKKKNYKGTFTVDSIKYVDKYKSNEKFVLNSDGKMINDISLTDKNYRPSTSLEYEDNNIKETYQESNDKVYNFNIYNIGNKNDNLFKKDIVEDKNFIENYSSYQILDDVNLNYNGYTYRIAKFTSSNSNKVDYKYIRYKNNIDVSSSYLSGYKYITNDILLENGIVKFIPVEIEQGQFANSRNDAVFNSSLDSQLCQNCKGVLKNRSNVETIFISRNEYDSLLARASNHNPYLAESNDLLYFSSNSYRYYKVTPYNKFGTYMYKYQEKDYLPSKLDLPLNGKKEMSENDFLTAFSKVNNITANYKNYPVFFSKESRAGYSKTFKNSITKTVELKKMRTHYLNSPKSFQLQKVSDAEFDSYQVVQEFENHIGLFIDKNIEVSTISKNSVNDLYSNKNIISSYSYSSKEEISDYSLLNQSNNDSVVIRSEIDSKNNIKTYDKYIETVKRNKEEDVIDNFIIKDDLGYYSFKYKSYFNLNQKYNLDYYFDGLTLVNKKELRIDNFITELSNLEENKDELEYLYEIIKSS